MMIPTQRTVILQPFHYNFFFPQVYALAPGTSQHIMQFYNDKWPHRQKLRYEEHTVSSTEALRNYSNISNSNETICHQRENQIHSTLMRA